MQVDICETLLCDAARCGLNCPFRLSSPSTHPSFCVHSWIRIRAANGCSPATVALAWTIRGGHVIAIPESGSAAHVKENAVALSLTLTPQELQTLDLA